MAKLDRLSRDVEHIASLMRRVDFKVGTMPQADKFQLHLFAALAEQESEFAGLRSPCRSPRCRTDRKNDEKLFIHTVLAATLDGVQMFSTAATPVTNDLIDDEGFECFYSREETLKQQCQLLIEETNQAWLEVRRACQNIAKLVQINTQLYSELTGLKKEHHRVRWELAEHMRKTGLKAGRQCNAFLGTHGRTSK